MGSITIRPCTASEVINSPEFPALRAEYAAESAVHGLPGPAEKEVMYQLMEANGAFQLFGAFMGAELVGFVAVLAPVLPHYGIPIAVTESLFVAAAHRKTGAGMALIRQAERHAREIGSPGLLVSAPSGGRLCAILPRIGYHETNRAFLKQL